MPSVENERYYPRPPEQVFAALQRTLEQHRFKVRHVDDFSKSVDFNTPASGFSWGARMSAQVRPAEDGSSVRIGGQSKMTANVTAKGAEARNIGRILNDLSNYLQQQG